VACLHAYSSMTADSGLITYAATNLGNQATPINQLLRVASPAGEIRSIEIVFWVRVPSRALPLRSSTTLFSTRRGLHVAVSILTRRQSPSRTRLPMEHF
jgi:hypothetical protein